MNTIAVDVRRVPHQASDLETDLLRARNFARLMDSQFNVGGFKFGIDALIGLIPVAGDAVSALAGLYPIYVARKHKLSRRTQALMVANLALDLVGGLVPVIGDFFDLAFRANQKNVELLERAVSCTRVQSKR